MERRSCPYAYASRKARPRKNGIFPDFASRERRGLRGSSAWEAMVFATVSDMGIPISKTLVIWAPPSHITLAIRVRITGDAHITRVLGMGMPISPCYRLHSDKGLGNRGVT